MDITTYIKAILGLAIVIGLIMGFAYVLKRMGFGDALRGPLGRKRRLATVEAVMLDSRHKAVLVRRDDVEHLVLVGPNTSQVIERGIPAPPPTVSADAPPGVPPGAPITEPTPAARFSQWIKK